ncbi:MAG: tRNA 2-thiocytidine(32) synthetase TtcA [Bdellovibrionales bacterium]
MSSTQDAESFKSISPLDGIRKKVVQTIEYYDMLSPNDKVLVAVSGGKDSSLLLFLLKEIQKRAPFPFHIHPVILDQKQPGFTVAHFRRWVNNLGFKLEVIEEDTYSIVKEKVIESKTFCGLCSRLRRGIIYNYAYENGFNKIALGHHADDLIETLLMNQFYSGTLGSMPPKLLSDDRRNVIIRPMAKIFESEIVRATELINPPIIPCNLCGSQENLKRKQIKKLISEMEKNNPAIKYSLIGSIGNVKPSQLLDRNIFDFNFHGETVGEI